MENSINKEALFKDLPAVNPGENIIRELTDAEIEERFKADEVANEAKAAFQRATSLRKRYKAMMELFWAHLEDSDERLQAVVYQDDKHLGVRLNNQGKSVVVIAKHDNSPPPEWGIKP